VLVGPAGPAAAGRVQGGPEAARAKTGTWVRLPPGPAEIIDNVPVGRLYRDGDIVTDANDRALPERRKLAFAGIVSVAIAIDGRGDVAGDPIVDLMGVPAKSRNGEEIADLIADAVGDVLDTLPKPKRRDPEAVENAVVRAIRGKVNEVWGKKPACHVLVIEV